MLYVTHLPKFQHFATGISAADPICDSNIAFTIIASINMVGIHVCERACVCLHARVRVLVCTHRDVGGGGGGERRLAA